jgi:flavodoxin
MKTIIICESVSHGNTRKVADAMAEVFGAKVVRPSEFDVSTAGEYDLIGLGSGIFHGKHHKSLLELAQNLPELKKSVFIFSTSGKGDMGQHKQLGLIVSNRGYSNAGEFICKGWDTWGPFKYIGGINKGLPNEAMLARARDFAQNIVDSAVTG